MAFIEPMHRNKPNITYLLTSTVFSSRFNEVKQKYLDFCHIYTDGSKVETKVASAYVCPYGTRGYRLRDGCSIFTAEVEAIDKALNYVKVSSVERFVIFSDSMSVLQVIESQESKNPLVNRVLQTCQKIISNGKFITFCWIPSHRDIRGNEDADRAAKDALSKAKPAHFELPCTDAFNKIQPFVSSLCQKSGIKKLVTNCTPSCPKLTRSITRDAQIERMKLLSIAFELIIRRRHYDVTDINQLFKTVSSKRILDFVKDIGLYNSL